MAKIVGLVGKANVGKSTFFGAATLKPVEIAGFPFTTIKADRGIGYIRAPCVCKEFGVQDNPMNSACVDGIRLIPVDLIDTPGLIPGAHQGKGLGNQFLDEVRRADALIVVADASGATDLNGQPVEAGINDPIEDVKMFEAEFDLWLKSLLRKDWDKVSRTAQSNKEAISKHLEEGLTGLGINRYQISQAVQRAGLDEFKSAQWTEAEPNIERIREAGYSVIPTCAEAELALRRAAEMGLVDYTPGDSDFTIKHPEKLTGGQVKALNRIKERVFDKWGGTGLQDVINEAFFSLLNMITVYPVENAEKLSNHQGQVLPDCYLVPVGTTSKQFAALIHTELAESFIFALNARTKQRLSDSYILENNDVIQIVSAKSRR